MKESTLRVSRHLQAIAQGLSEILEEISGEKLGFTLLVFTEQRAQYVSNCKREESVAEIKHLLELWDKGQPDIPAHEVQS